MSATCQLRENKTPIKVAGRSASLFPAWPALMLHPSTGSQRVKVEQYVFDQFQASHGATVRDFMPLLFTTMYNDEFTAAVGIRPASGHDLFLEQYLQEKVESVLTRLTGQNIERQHIVEVGNLVATRGGSSQFLYLIMAAILQQADFKWLVITATPPVRKAIQRLGFNLYPLADADSKVLDAAYLSDWGTYYECQPCVFAGSLSEALSVLTNQTNYTQLISHIQNRIDALALTIKQRCFKDAQHSCAA